MGLDIRIPIGLLFVLLGGMLALFGLFTKGQYELYERSLKYNINLGWGGVMFLFGILMVLMGYRRRPVRPVEARQEGESTPSS